VLIAARKPKRVTPDLPSLELGAFVLASAQHQNITPHLIDDFLALNLKRF
jgi:hypothetical protein